jgi:hypothetical protein
MSRIPKTLRVQVRERASGICEYCQKPEFLSTNGFHVDHIIPERHGGNSNLDNLAWACFDCNIAKGTDIASIDPDTRQITPLYNPRTQIWEQHFAKQGQYIVGKSAVGRTTVQILMFNHETQLEIRQILIDAGAW